MHILYLHGCHAIQGSAKPTFLAKQGHTVINPAASDKSEVRKTYSQDEARDLSLKNQHDGLWEDEERESAT